MEGSGVTENRGLAPNSPLSPKQISIARFAIGGFFLFLAGIDLLTGAPPTSDGRWAWLYAVSRQVFGEHGRVIFETLVGLLFVFWGWATYPRDSMK